MDLFLIVIRSFPVAMLATARLLLHDAMMTPA
jgi:hypothetical protein